VLAANQTSIQATGRETKSLIKLAKVGCLSRDVKLYDEGGKQIRLSSGLFGVAGRYQLTKAGKIVVPPAGSSTFFARNPRTLAGRTADGTIVLVTIDGRQTTSVGTTLAETARVAQALGMVDAVNLDGGGSTALSVRGALANKPSGSSGERAVGDALVYIDSPLPNGP
jgi:exopolysaccharide biosynthesis protein